MELQKRNDNDNWHVHVAVHLPVFLHLKLPELHFLEDCCDLSILQPCRDVSNCCDETVDGLID